MFRKARKEDIATIVQFQLAMAKETENLQLDQDTLTKGVSHVVLGEGQEDYYVWDEGEQNLSACLMTLPEWSEWRNGSVLWIHSVYVTPQSRRKGLYKKMYQKLQEMVQEDSGLRGLRLYVDKTNTSAQKVYESLGMSDEHYQLYEWMNG